MGSSRRRRGRPSPFPFKQEAWRPKPSPTYLKMRNLGRSYEALAVSKKSLNGLPSTKSTASSGVAGPVGVRAFPRETSAVKLVVCVHNVRGLLGACGRTEGCGLGGRRKAARAHVEVDDERELEKRPSPRCLRSSASLVRTDAATLPALSLKNPTSPDVRRASLVSLRRRGAVDAGARQNAPHRRSSDTTPNTKREDAPYRRRA